MEIIVIATELFQVRFYTSEYERLRRYANEHDLTESEVVEEIVQHGLDEVLC